LYHGTYHRAFGFLLIPAVLCFVTLTVSRVAYPRPQELEGRTAQFLKTRGFSKAYWIYLTAGVFIACGFADFSLIAFHFHKTAVISQELIPVFYAVAMATGGLASFVIGSLLDKIGLPVLLAAFLLPAFSAPLVFLSGHTAAFIGMVVWGIGIGAQDSSLKAVLAGVIPPERRSTGFGVFDTGFGIAWFLGSATMGLLYDRSLVGLVVFSTILQLAALPVLFYGNRREYSQERSR
jgi:predicted MFS family arabinose efflux permease